MARKFNFNQLNNANNAVSDMLKKINPIQSNSFKRNRLLDTLDSEVDSLIGDEIGNLTSITGDNISTFMVKLYNKTDERGSAPIESLEDVFEENTGMMDLMEHRHKIRNLKFDDISTMSKKLFELNEAINTTRDAIITADDLSQIVSRNLKFNNLEGNIQKKNELIKVIEKLEAKHGLASKLKNHIIPKTLEYGAYYVYTIPYSKILQSSINKASEKSARPVAESSFMGDIDLKKDCNINFDNITVYNNSDHIPIPILEGVSTSMLTDDVALQKHVNNTMKTKVNTKDVFANLSDGTIDKKTENYISNIRDCYVELLDPRKIRKVKILNKTIGYCYISEVSEKPVRDTFSNSIVLKDSKSSPEDIESKFILDLADRIIKAMDKPFLEENGEFKDLIVNTLQYKNLYRKKAKFQFIPAEYITEFAVNKDIHDEGVSMLEPSLFPGMLFLTLLIFKTMTIVSKSNDTRINYIKDMGNDKNIANKINKLARTMKSRELSLDDIMNYHTMTTKVGNGKQLYVPVGKSGERGLEFDILSGQSVELHSELMDMLKNGYINATSVPSVIMNYINEADYSRTLVMANAKFLGRVVSYQLDFNEATTELYRKILAFSTDMELDDISSFEYVLAAPKSLNNNNLADLISSSENTISFIIKSMTSDLSEQNEDDNMLKDILHKEIVREILPMIQWDKMDSLMENAKLELARRKLEKIEPEEEY